MASVTVRQLTKTYAAGVTPVDSIDFQIEDGGFLTLLGPSGCGKSTILRMIAGLEPVTSGEILIDDRLVNPLHPSERDIAMVFQSYALYPHMTVRENIAVNLKLRKVSSREIADRVAETARLLDIEPLLDRKPKALSGGQRQRVALGRAIIRKPKVFLLDEPLSNLDALLREKMRTELKALFDQLGTTVIYVTHDQTEAMTMSSKIAVLHEGRIQQFGTPDQIYNEPANPFVASFVGSPRINLLRARSYGNGRVKIGEQSISGGNVPSREGEFLLGVRPENVSIYELATPDALRAEVKLVEPLGPYTVLSLAIGSEELKAIVEPEFCPPGHVWVKFEKVHSFDAEPEQSL